MLVRFEHEPGQTFLIGMSEDWLREAHKTNIAITTAEGAVKAALSHGEAAIILENNEATGVLYWRVGTQYTPRYVTKFIATDSRDKQLADLAFYAHRQYTRKGYADASAGP